MDKSIVEYFSGHEGYRCGYCSSPDTCYSHGMWAHTMTPLDYQNLIDRGWRRFVEWAQNEIAVVPDFHKRILFSNEAHFWLNGYVNKQNCRIWSEANPQVYVETSLHPEKLTVWCALWAGGIIGPYFFKIDEGHNVTVNGDRYRAMITNFFIPELNNHDVQELWFQQHGATCHTARATIDILKDTFGDRLISRFGPVNWPPRSCDLTPLDYFLWGYVKSLVYADKPQTLKHLEDNIRRVIADIRPQMLEKVIENWTSRLDYIRASRGSPMPAIIFKMSGKYCYKPTMNVTCCPLYTIRCEAKKFVLTRSQKKVLKKVHRFLAYGEKSKPNEVSSADRSDQDMDTSEFPQDIDVQSLKKIKRVKTAIKQSDIKADDTETNTDSPCVDNSQNEKCDSAQLDQFSSTISSQSARLRSEPSSPLKSSNLNSKPQCRKAKEIRKERKLQKLLKQGMSEEEASALITPKINEPKSLEDFLTEPFPPNPAHKLELRLVPSSIENPLFSKYFDDSYNVYKKYQMSIHKDPAEKVTTKQYTRFLVTNPFQINTR
ncbi:arginyl-tRNA--protein transferase 1 [Trichonephila clavipes]|nr:arginyl-tRNA--protein transferase 1 [Trichonephila clavipes]